MSGPKLSAAEIERQKQEQLERERQEAIRKLTEARETYNRSRSKIKDLIYHAHTLIKEVDDPYRSEAESKLNSIISSIDINRINSSNPDDYLKESADIEGKVGGYTEKIDHVLQPALARSKNNAAVSKGNTALKDLSDVLLDRGSEKKTIHIDFSCNYSEESLKNSIQNTITQYSLLMRNDDAFGMKLFHEYAIRILQELFDTGIFNEKECKKTLQRLYDEEEEALRKADHFRKKYDTYISLTSILKINPSGVAAFQSYEELEEIVDNLLDDYREKDEMDFIADQINEVMDQLGYSLVSSSVLTKKDLGETDYSLYRESDRSGIAVYTDQSGAVMMRMTVLGNDDNITENDREFSYQNQIQFCARHKNLVEALKKRGIYLKQKSYRSPNRDHTYKVNIKGKDKSDLISGKENKTQKEDRRAKRRAGSKKMREMQL